MGCSCGTSRKLQETNEFFREAMGFKRTNKKGIEICDPDTLQTKSFVGSFFEEEIVEFADESAPVKPWLENVVPPKEPLIENPLSPKYSLVIEHVFGLRVEDARDTLFFLDKERILFAVGCLAVVQNIDDCSQRLFGGFPIKGTRDCHDGCILSLAFFKSRVSMVATGQRGLIPKILVWSPVNPNVVYARFEQPKDSKEVSGLAFGGEGSFVASFGKDKRNSFYVFDLITKEMIYMHSTDSESKIKETEENEPECDGCKKTEINEFLLDLAFNPDPKSYELCVVGVNKIIFCTFTGIERYRNVYDKDQETESENIFTSCCYINNREIFIGNDIGKVYIYEGQKMKEKLGFGSGSIQVIKHIKKFNRIFLSDSDRYLYLLDDKSYKQIEYFKENAIVKSLDINENYDIIMGLSNGEIKIKYHNNELKKEEVFLKSHATGSIRGIAYVPEFKCLTTGDDNQILLWNLRSKKCEAFGQIGINIFMKGTRGLCISYNLTRYHVAVGLDNGQVTIRNDEKNLGYNCKFIPDIEICEDKIEISEVKYTDYGDYLVVCNKKGDIVFLNVNNKYEKETSIQNDDYYITCLDWDSSGRYIRTCTNTNKYVFFDKDDKKEVKPDDINIVEWSSTNCKFDYSVQGVYLGSTNPDYISSVSKSHYNNLLCSGNDDYLLNLSNYPCITENTKIKQYRGHAGKITKIIWLPNDQKVLTIAEEDKAIIVWDVEAEKIIG